MSGWRLLVQARLVKKEVSPASIQVLKPLRVLEVAIASKEPHPNPPLAKGRGPE
ncbi:hypothetical protein NG799_11390 [Laspinema sp. D1]|uniref:Uncharacterized protein n=1 Tax=Laspinema palackyanum D2a TaxID=2953684 RepID=A0ABT2MQC3_9CYAN|nr:hypothetical protein [Laspinema sp. D2a]